MKNETAELLARMEQQRKEAAQLEKDRYARIIATRAKILADQNSNANRDEGAMKREAAYLKKLNRGK